MNFKKAAQIAHRFADPFRVDKGKRFRLRDYDPEDTRHLTSDDKDRAGEALRLGVETLSELQERLYAESKGDRKRSLLLVVQGMDTSGKGGIMRYVVGAFDGSAAATSAQRCLDPSP